MRFDNLLDLENPDDYGCYVQNYAIGHSELDVCIESKTDRFYVNFGWVFAYSGRVRWGGAALRQASDEEYLQFMRDLADFEGKSDEELLDTTRYGRLFIFEGKRGTFKIVAVAYSKLVDAYPHQIYPGWSDPTEFGQSSDQPEE